MKNDRKNRPRDSRAAIQRMEIRCADIEDAQTLRPDGSRGKKISWDFGRKWAVGSKKLVNYLEVTEKLPIFAARMRVAYRRDDIKLRNRSFYTKPLVEYLRL